MARTIIPIKDMHCASCAVTIERALSKTPGVEQANVNFALGRAIVDHDDAKVPSARLADVIRKAGYEPVVASPPFAKASGGGRVMSQESRDDDRGHHHPMHAHHGGAHEHAGPRKIEMILALAIAIPLLGTMVWRPDLGSIGGKATMDATALIAGWTLVAVFGRLFHASALRAVLRGRANMDTLVSLGSLAAIVWSTYAFFTGGVMYAEVAGTIIAFILLGKYLEARARSRTAASIESLLALHPNLAHRIESDGSMTDLDPLDLQLGDRCIVKPGEQIPTDGVVTDGETTVDESMLTGEPIPIVKSKGDAVTGGTMNATGSVTMSVTAAAGKTTLDAIIRTVENALMSKSPVERLADQISAIFVPTVIGIALITLAAWMALSVGIGEAIRHAVAVLIVACPCALGLATPAAMAVGTGAGAKRGILVKEGSALESARGIDMIVFDKTGTLTEGKPSVTDLLEQSESGADRIELLRIAAALERPSEHPFAAAILKYVDASAAADVSRERVSSFRAVSGKGVEGTLDGMVVALGTESFIAERGIRIPDDLRQKTDELRNDAKTVMIISRGNEVIGAIAAQDRLRPESADAVAALKAMGLRVALLTGDHLASANAVARALGIADVFADVSPTKKGEIVASLQQDGKRVAFVGDGINDAPALAQSDLGIAVGTGTDVAIATGEIVVMNGSPAKVVEAINLSRTTFRAIRQNLFWAFFYNIVGIPLAAFGLLNPIIAALAMAFSSVSVLGNSLRVAGRMRKA